MYLEGRLSDALESLDQARTLGSDDPWLELNTADVYAAQGRLDEAAQRYQAVVDSGTKEMNAMRAALEGLIQYNVNFGKFNQADALYRRQIVNEPSVAWTYGNYGAFLLCWKDDADTAIAQFRVALSRLNYGMARRGLAAALYREWVALPKGKQSGSVLAEAKRLSAGTPNEVVIGFCQHGPAVASMLEAGARGTRQAR